MAETALSSIGVVFGWGIGTLKQAPSSWTEVEECISIGGVSVSNDNIDVTPLNSKRKKYIPGHEDTGGELPTTFNFTDTFAEQWEAVRDAYDSKSNEEEIWFCAYHPSRKKMSAYIVAPGSVPKPEYTVGDALQVEITNTLIDLPDDIAAVKPVAPSGN